MIISILTTSEEHPIKKYLANWVKKQKKHQISIVHSNLELISGDILFLISCHNIISKSDREKFSKTLLIHASDLPYGRGWSPYIWDIINGESNITLSLLEADDKVDSGDIWKKISVNIPKTFLFDEIQNSIFNAELDLMNFAIENFNTVNIKKQPDIDVDSWPKRSPKDSEVDINQSILEQFDLIRVCDPKRLPAYFYKDGIRFNILLEKYNE